MPGHTPLPQRIKKCIGLVARSLMISKQTFHIALESTRQSAEVWTTSKPRKCEVDQKILFSLFSDFGPAFFVSYG